MFLNSVNFTCNRTELEKVLNDIYKQAGAVKWTVENPISLDVKDKAWDKDNDNKLLIQTSPFHRYSNEMDAIIDAIKTEPDAYYVIITDLPNSLGYAGYMPLKSDFAFLFTRESSNASPKSAYQTIAHELGHGAFYLKHIDDEYKILDASDNLMNRYAAGTTLWKPQWDWIGDPSWRLYLFQKEEEGAMANGESHMRCISRTSQLALANQKLYYTPDGRVFKIPDNSTPLAFFFKNTGTENLRYSLSTFMVFRVYSSFALRFFWVSIRFNPLITPTLLFF